MLGGWMLRLGGMRLRAEAEAELPERKAVLAGLGGGRAVLNLRVQHRPNLIQGCQTAGSKGLFMRRWTNPIAMRGPARRD